MQYGGVLVLVRDTLMRQRGVMRVKQCSGIARRRFGGESGERGDGTVLVNSRQPLMWGLRGVGQ